ncbi:hypothetical protein LP418_14380 [Nocardioides sp. B-3]|nr:hypothetical protein [Nocardioides sp. B-3]UUZ57646.1 hypothetical protein LP418_14380 [Nocardioides sp. B-3]
MAPASLSQRLGTPPKPAASLLAENVGAMLNVVLKRVIDDDEAAYARGNHAEPMVVIRGVRRFGEWERSPNDVAAEDSETAGHLVVQQEAERSGVATTSQPQLNTGVVDQPCLPGHRSNIVGRELRYKSFQLVRMPEVILIGERHPSRARVYCSHDPLEVSIETDVHRKMMDSEPVVEPNDLDDQGQRVRVGAVYSDVTRPILPATGLQLR